MTKAYLCTPIFGEPFTVHKFLTRCSLNLRNQRFVLMVGDKVAMLKVNLCVTLLGEIFTLAIPIAQFYSNLKLNKCPHYLCNNVSHSVRFPGRRLGYNVQNQFAYHDDG